MSEVAAEEKEEWCNCHESDGTCPYHDNPELSRWAICDICVRRPWLRERFLAGMRMSWRGVLEVVHQQDHEGAISTFDPWTDPAAAMLGPPAIESVTFFADGFQWVQHELGDGVFCPEHRLSLAVTLPKVFGQNKRRRKKGK